MITKDEASTIFAFLIILFSVEDLIGDKNLMKIEEKWRDISSVIFLGWQDWLRNSFVWWGYLLIYSVLVLLPLIIVMIGIGLPIWIFPKFVIFNNELCGGLTIILLEIFVGLIAWLILIFINNYFSEISSGDDPPLEIRILRKFSNFAEWYPETYMRTPGVSGPEGVLLFTVFLSGIIVPVTSITLITLRLIFLLLTIILWIAFFGPAVLLQSIAKRTGAASYIKVGRYLISIIGFILTTML
jgi:hypothetical protein